MQTSKVSSHSIQNCPHSINFILALNVGQVSRGSCRLSFTEQVMQWFEVLILYGASDKQMNFCHSIDIILGAKNDWFHMNNLIVGLFVIVLVKHQSDLFGLSPSKYPRDAFTLKSGTGEESAGGDPPSLPGKKNSKYLRFCQIELIPYLNNSLHDSKVVLLSPVQSNVGAYVVFLWSSLFALTGNR